MQLFLAESVTHFPMWKDGDALLLMFGIIISAGGIAGAWYIHKYWR